MNLLIMRHGEAEPFGGRYQDETRPLTDFGREAVKISAQSVAKSAPELLLVSPLLRTQQTADLVEASLDKPSERRSCSWILSESSVAQAVRELAQLDSECILLVSHMPFVSLLVEYLTGEQVGFRPADVMGVSMDYVGGGQGECRWIS